MWNRSGKRGMRFLTGLAVVALVLVLAAGCGGSDTGSKGDKPAPKPDAGTPAGDTILLKNVQFQPKNYTVKAGTTVTFVNQDKVEHNVNVGEPGAEPEIKGPTVEMGAKWDLTFDKPGTYKIFCTTGDHWRLGMVGTVTVE